VDYRKLNDVTKRDSFHCFWSTTPSTRWQQPNSFPPSN
jgi:hypothetical protein